MSVPKLLQICSPWGGFILGEKKYKYPQQSSVIFFGVSKPPAYLFFYVLKKEKKKKEEFMQKLAKRYSSADGHL